METWLQAEAEASHGEAAAEGDCCMVQERRQANFLPFPGPGRAPQEPSSNLAPKALPPAVLLAIPDNEETVTVQMVTGRGRRFQSAIAVSLYDNNSSPQRGAWLKANIG